jgi:methylglutaconyl-CoA hydratase
MSCISTHVQGNGVRVIELVRPEVHNALNRELIEELESTLADSESDPKTRVVVLTGAGKSFCAGADLKWMSESTSLASNEEDAAQLARLLRKLNGLSLPTVARVHGSAYGGGLGLIVCCDIAVAASTAMFSFSEVRLGIVPAVISPYAIVAIGERNARRYLLSAERFDAAEARRIGLVHEVVEPAALDSTVASICEQILQGAPKAIGTTKRLILRPGSDEDNIRTNAEARAGSEAREGIAAFREKRKPRW